MTHVRELLSTARGEATGGPSLTVTTPAAEPLSS